jgi:hypothetical protein
MIARIWQWLNINKERVLVTFFNKYQGLILFSMLLVIYLK